MGEIDKVNGIGLPEKQIKILAVLSGKPESAFLNFKQDEITQFFEQDLSYLKTQIPEEPIKDFYFVNGKKYRLIRQIGDLTAGQFIDLMTCTKEKDTMINRLHFLLTVFLIPVREKRRWFGKNEISVEKYMETSVDLTAEEIYQYMSIVDVMAMSVFFCALNQLFLIYTALYLIEVGKTQLDQSVSKISQTKDLESLKALLSQIDFMNVGNG